MDLACFLFSFFIFDDFFLKVKRVEPIPALEKRPFTASGPFFLVGCGRAVDSPPLATKK